VTLTKVLTIYHSWIHPLSSFSFLPLPGILSTGLIFPYSYMSTYCFDYIHPPTPFPCISPPPTGTKPQTGPILLSCSPSLKKRHFLQDASYIGSFIVTFPRVYVFIITQMGSLPCDAWWYFWRINYFKWKWWVWSKRTLPAAKCIFGFSFKPLLKCCP
jgi:hypothetical protein